MQSDSAQFLNAEPIKEVGKFSAQPTVKSFKCGKCTLVFKSKVYLFEHLNNVHGLDVHTALQDAGLKYAEADKNLSSEKKNLKCQHCDFKTCHQDLFKKHKKQCPQNENLTEALSSSKNQGDEEAGIPADHLSEAAELEEIPSVLSDASTSVTKCSLGLLKDLKTYKRPPQTFDNHFKNPPGLNGTEAADDSIETLILQETLVASSPDSNSVSQATGKSMIDVTVRGCSELLLSDNFSAGLRPGLSKQQRSEPGQSKVGKRTNCKPPESPPAKKTKSFQEGELSPIKNVHLSPCPDFSFEVSEDEEEEGKVNHGDPQGSEVLFCKHCDFREEDFNLMSLHYQNDHPYVRCTAAYVSNSNDHSATFRCLECPVEFSSAVDLKWHYTEKHPAAPDVFKLKSSELCLHFKCFQCSFTCDALKPLRQHYKENHPACDVDNSLLFCRYSVTKSSQDEESCELHKKSPCPESITERSPERESQARTEILETPSPQRLNPTRPDVHTCEFCTFSHKSVVVLHVHYRKHHPDEANSIAKLRRLSSSPSSKSPQTPQKATSKKEDPDPSKQKRVLFMQVGEASTLTHPTSKEHVRKHQGEAQTDAQMKSKEADAEDLSAAKSKAYGDAEKLFYCETCNYGNPSVKGIQNHQMQIHRHTVDHEFVAAYTSMICEQIKKSKAANKGSSFFSHLPRPILNRGDENRFFCPICNYRHSNIKKVMSHRSQSHSEFDVKSAHIQQYTTEVLKQMKKTPPEIEVNRKKEEDKKKLDALDSPSVKTPQGERKLQCYRCDFYTPFVFVLKRHLMKVHNVCRAFKDVIRHCFRAGSLGSGYHCEWCVFSHEYAVGLYKHYQTQHPNRQTSYVYIDTHLYAGPMLLQANKKKPKLVTTIYPMFKKNSKEKPSSTSQVEDLSKIPGLFESFQVPLDETDDQALPAHEEFKCPSCPESFRSQNNLSAHRRAKHKNVVETQTEAPMHVHVFRCLRCPYISNIYQGVITHSQMKHPNTVPDINSLLLSAKYLHNWEEYMKNRECGEVPKVHGYVCEKCQQIYKTLKKLKKHCSAVHPVGEPNSVQDKDASDSSDKLHGDKGSSSTTLFLNRKKYGKIKCQHCSYVCNSKIAFNQHLHSQHKSFASKDTFKCALCSHVFFQKKKLKSHYIKEHDKSAYLKYYVPLCKKYKTSQDSAQQPKMDSTDNMRLVLKCPVCPYVNTKHHGTLTHCQMKHPDVFVRANELETKEMLLPELPGCLTGKSSSEGGYVCDTCGEFMKSSTKFKTHCQRNHKTQGVSSPSRDTEVEKTPVKTPPVKPPSETAFSSSDLESSPSKKSPAQGDVAYKCQLCSHRTTCRKYLRSHYQNTHKLDGISIYKLLEKYNRRKRSYLSQCSPGEKHKNVQGEESIRVRCRQCPDVVLDSQQLLIEHYSNFHGLGSKLEFKVLSSGVKKNSTGIYKCYHCLAKLYGTRKLHYHLDSHRAELMKQTKVYRQDGLSTFENVEERKSSRAEEVAPSSPLKVVKADPEATEDGHTCKQCGRTFMSLSGLHSHEQSHAALAAIKKLDHPSTSEDNLEIDKYLVHKTGTLKPFRCSCCSYRTTLLGLLRRHFMKKHQDVIQRDIMTKSSSSSEHPSPTSGKTPPYQIDTFSDLDVEPEESEESVYSEPPDVQRQLNHYNLMAQNPSKDSDSFSSPKLAKSRRFYCEFCDFETEHPSSIRRHYLSQHGKKILRCKDCSFFTGLRKSLEMHIDTGHLTVQPTTTYQKDFRCPFCLYQSKNKNHMIDHIVLHREERVVPIEVHRPKLSRYLQGIVFRCHRCTFSCGSAKALHVHMMRHSDVKPFKCRLCYFDCTLLKDLEEHLSDKHQVVRNHELVGQVSLDQLESRIDKRKEKDLDLTDFQDCADISEAENMSNDDNEKKTILKELLEKRDEDRKEENSSKSATDLQCEATNHKPGLQELAEAQTALIHSVGELEAANVHQKEDCSDLEGEAHQKMNQDNPRHSLNAEMKEEDVTNVLSSIKEEEDLNDDSTGSTVPTLNDHVNTTCSSPSVEDAKDGSSPENPLQPPVNADSIALKECKEELEQIDIQEAPEHFGEMPVLENELLKEEDNEEERMVSEDGGTCDKKEDISRVDEAAVVLLPPRFKCEYCGRNFPNTFELTRHVARHGL
ncbi:zinc finger protein 462 [Oryzias melastigma]|uniref:Zinc finger protein 462-like n=1 Tax=Oryzias melastigma TaxID=30732 RepID=A0A3B3DI30_ORYME|nr:zinc finger protein 462 [Oryzias melastigma]